MRQIRENAYAQLIKRANFCNRAMKKADKSTPEGVEVFLYWHRELYRARDRRHKLIKWENKKGLLD